VRSFRRRLVVVAAFSAATAVTIVVSAPGAPSESVARTVRASTPTSSTAVAVRASVAPTTHATTTTRPAATVPPRTLAEGATGPDVFALQAALVRHGYWLRDEPGTFGTATEHAVVAFEKAMGFARDGIVDAAEAKSLRRSERVAPRSATGRVFEIDLQRQLMLDVDNGRVTWVFDTSTGAVPGSTPTGNFRVYQEVDGWVHGDLGTLYRPKFFTGNVGIHGSPYIPPYPASHGCARLPNEAMDWIWASGDLQLGTEVWVY
jgi:peptidoglycan hydrolase-like protein with peptidoglycan-binding domain